MDNSQAKQFGEELSAVFDVYGKDRPSKLVKTVWWRALANYGINDVLKALSLHVQSCPVFPKPSHIIAILTKSDGRPEAEEAWAIALKGVDEAETVVWTSETAKAMAFANSLTESGDNNVSARMAFKQHYERLLAEARTKGTPVEWQISAGFNAERRKEVVENSVLTGLISREKANQYLIPDMTSEGKEIAGLLGFSGEVTPITESKLHKERMEKLKADVQAMAEESARKKQAEEDAYEQDMKARRALLLEQEGQLLAEAGNRYSEGKA